MNSLKPSRFVAVYPTPLHLRRDLPGLRPDVSVPLQRTKASPWPLETYLLNGWPTTTSLKLPYRVPVYERE